MTKFKWKLPAIIYSVLIFLVSSLPQERMIKVEIWNFDKIEHLVEYSFYGILMMLAFATSKSDRVPKHAAFFSIVVGILFSATDEIHQHFVPGRTCSIFDLLADTIGIFLGVWYFTKSRWFVRLRNTMNSVN